MSIFLSKTKNHPSFRLRRTQRGFTFIEVIIIFTIIFIMTAVLMSMSFKERSSKEIETVANEVVASIRETQNNALTGKQKDNMQLPCAFKFGFVNPESSDPSIYNAYQMFYSSRDLDATCPLDDASNINSSFLKTIVLPANITITAHAEDTNKKTYVKNHVIFTVPYGGFTIKDDASDSNEYNGIDIVVAKNDEKYHICVHETGLVEELGFNENDIACSF